MMIESVTAVMNMSKEKRKTKKMKMRENGWNTRFIIIGQFYFYSFRFYRIQDLYGLIGFNVNRWYE